MNKEKVILKKGWTPSKRFEYATFKELHLGDQQKILSGKVYRLLGHSLEDCWLYPVRKDGRLTLSARRIRLNTHKRLQKKIRLLTAAESSSYLDQVKGGPWDSWKFSGSKEIKISMDYFITERLPDLRERILKAFGVVESPATPLGIACISPGAYERSHFHDTDTIVLALSKRNKSGQLAIKQKGKWKRVEYDIGEAIIIPKYVEHKVFSTSIDRYTAILGLLD